MCRHLRKVTDGTWSDVLYRMFWVFKCLDCGATIYSKERFR